ncbi:MAG: orotate phosphoribosyltransferase [Christensenellales bacterium]|mgnify:CR=1 FL=1|jgi:orotate phosphoribosyltransferase
MGNEIAREVSKILLEIKAVFLRPQEPFTWASGIQSPIYCDNRLILAYPEQRNKIVKALAQTIQENYKDVEVLMGTATAGIPHAAMVSEVLKLPMGYVRAGSKDHGRKNQIEGAAVSGKKVVVVEDLISTAGSSIEVANILAEAGADVLGIISIFTYNMQKGFERLAEANLTNISLSTFDVLVDVAFEENYISEKEVKMLRKFRDAPQDPSWQIC